MDNPILYGVGLLVADLPWYIMAVIPFGEQARFKRWVIVLIGGLVGLLKAFSGALLAMLVANWRDWNFVHYLVHTLLLLTLYSVCFKVDFAKLIYMLLLLQAIATTVNFSACTVVAAIHPGVQIALSRTPAYTLAIAAGNLIACPIVWRFFRGSLKTAFREISAKNFWFLCVQPILFFFLNQIFATSIQKTGIATNQISLLTLLIVFTGLITYYVSLRTVLDNARYVRLESEAQTRLALQVQNYENLTQGIERSRAARHDLRHHINVIRDFAARDDKEGMIKYLDEYAAGITADNGPDWCENQSVNALLKHYLGLAAEAGARLDVKIDLPAHTRVKDTVLCVVFGNIFENAAASVTAKGKDSFIRARCENSETDIVLTVENSVGDSVPHGEGLGLKNVAAAVKNHGGTVRFEERNGIYFSRVILRKDPADRNEEPPAAN